MIAAAVFTGGAALMAGIGSFTSTAGSFAAKFMAGAKGFMAGLANPMSTWKGAISGAQSGSGILAGAAQGSGAVQAAGQAGVQAGAEGAAGAMGPPAPDAATAGLEGAKQGAGEAAAQAMGPPVERAGSVASQAMGPPAPAGSEVVAGATKIPGVQPSATGGWLTKAAEFGKDVLQSPVTAQLVQGYASGKAEEDYLKRGGYYDRQWADPRQRMILEEASEGARGGFLDRARRYTEGRAGAITPSSSRISGYQRGERSSGYAPAGG
jgi:hypothetical protein